MIRFTWLQFRPQAAIVSGALAVVALALALSGTRLAHLYDASGLAACHANCGALATGFQQRPHACLTHVNRLSPEDISEWRASLDRHDQALDEA